MEIRNIFRSLLAIHLALFFTTISSFAQESFQKVSPFPETQVHCLLVDGNRVWAGTENGLYMSESGAEFTKMAKEQISCSYSDLAGQYYFGTYDGKVVEVNNGTIRVLDFSKETEGQLVHCLARTNDGTLWIGTLGAGLFTLKEGADEPKKVKSDLIFLNALQVDVQNNLWIASEEGFYKIPSGDKKPVKLENLISATALQAYKGSVWVAGFTHESGLQLLKTDNLSSWQNISLPLELNLRIKDIFVESPESLWIAANLPARYNNGKWELIQSKQSYTGKLANAVAVDAAGNIWIGTEGKGLFADYKVAPVKEAEPKLATIKDLAAAASVTPEALAREYRLDIRFEQGKSILLAGYLADLDHLATIMKKNPMVDIELDGHTDNVGDLVKNLKLSQDRAEAVKKYLVESHIIDASRIKTFGHGGKKPISSTNKEMNRRVEVRFRVK